MIAAIEEEWAEVIAGDLVPMQVEGVATGLVFLTGTAYMWLAYAERPAPLPTPTRILNRI
jgi:hypothetical protein